MESHLHWMVSIFVGEETSNLNCTTKILNAFPQVRVLTLSSDERNWTLASFFHVNSLVRTSSKYDMNMKIRVTHNE